MPTATTDDGTELYYEVEGDGKAVVFVGEAGLGAWQWSWQHGRVAGPYQSVVWDLRGTGRSDSSPGPYDVGRLASDLDTVLTAADIKNAHLVGAGLGGMIALRYAREFSRAETLTLFNTAENGTDIDITALRDLCGPKSDVAELKSSLSGGFSSAFRTANPDQLDQICEWRNGEDATRDGFDAQVAAVETFESGPLYELALPTLVCHGLDDPVVDVGAGRELADDLPRGTFEPVEGKHLCFIEHSRAVTDRVLQFIEDAGE